MSSKRYDNPSHFKKVFKKQFQGRQDQELVVLMQRFAARVCHTIEGAVIKGGLGLELRLDTPRTTKDADMIIAGSQNLDARLKSAGAVDLDDFLRYSVQPASRGAEIHAPGLLYPGKRYKVQARFASGSGPWPGDPYRAFTAEISVREPAGYDVIDSVLEGFPQAKVAPIRIYSLDWQIAEKVHAFTDPRHTCSDNHDLMRPRDLLDICRCAIAATGHARVEGAALRHALEQTFQRRKAAAAGELQDLPPELPRMPAAWEGAFNQAMQQGGLPWRSSDEAHEVAARFLNPVLGGAASGVWDPDRQAWGEVSASVVPVSSAPQELAVSDELT